MPEMHHANKRDYPGNAKKRTAGGASELPGRLARGASAGGRGAGPAVVAGRPAGALLVSSAVKVTAGRVMVTGGAGYIGAHVVRMLQEHGHDVLVVDDLSTGRADRIGDADLLRLDVAGSGAAAALRDALTAGRCEAVVHLAARKAVGESVAHPLRYWQQNVTGLANVLTAVTEAGVDRVVFSSSAAVYGSTGPGQVDEDAPTAPVNPYGETKLAGEWLLRSTARATGLRQVSLRYFNVAGAGWPDLADPAVQNLVTLVLDRWRRGEPAVVLGTDYPTEDGSCVRDYVHVGDLARAHVAALAYLDRAERPADVLNIGTGRGASVLEMVRALAAAAGGGGPVVHGERRPGDPARVVADPSRAVELLRWRAQADVAEIARSAWAAHQASPPASV